MTLISDRSTQTTFERSDVSRNLGRLLAARVSAMALQFLALAILARNLGPSGFGIIQVGMAVIVFLNLATDLGLSTLGVRDVLRPGAGVTIGDVLRGRLVLGAAALAVAALVVIVVPVAEGTIVIGAIFASAAVANVLHLRWVLQGGERFVPLGVVDVAGAAIQLLGAIVLVRGPDNLAGAAAAVASGPIVSSLLAAFIARDLHQTSRSGLQRTVQLIARALPLGLAALATTVYYTADSLILGVTRPISEAGAYGAAYRVVVACLALPFVGHLVAVPVLSRLMHGDDLSGAEAVLSSLSRMLLVPAAGIAVGGAVTASAVIPAIYGQAFEGAILPLVVLIWSCVTVSANAPLAALMIARRDDRQLMAITVSGAVTNVVLNLVFIPVYGPIGAAFTTIVTEVLVLGAIIAATRDVSLRILASAVRAALVPAIGVAVVALPLRETLLVVPLAAIAFVTLALLTRAIRPQEIQGLLGVAATPR